MKTNVVINTNVVFQEDTDDLQQRVEDFKDDPEQMEFLIAFVNDVLDNASIEAEKKSDLQKLEQQKTSRSGSMVSSLKNTRIANRARGFMVRMYDVICNCANSATAPATQRINLKIHKTKK